MHTVGTEDAGFSVVLDTEKRTVRVVGWGFWPAEVAKRFDEIVVEVCRYAPKGVDLSMDMSRLKPMRDEGQSAFRNTIAILKQSKVAQISVATGSHLTKLQLVRIAREAAPRERVRFY